MRQTAVVQYSRPCGHRRPRGRADTPPQLGLTRVEHGNPDRVRCAQHTGKPTVRKAQSLGGNRMPKKRMPVGRKATGNQDGKGCSFRRRDWITGRIPHQAGDGCRSGVWLRKQADVRQVSL
jgi:hypothetical protein